MKILLACVLMSLLCGCRTAAPGRVTGFEWDSRSPEQLVAAGGTPTARAVPVGVWSSLVSMLPSLNVRIRLLVVEWGATE